MNLLFLTFVFPLLGYILLSLSRERISENVAALIGVDTDLPDEDGVRLRGAQEAGHETDHPSTGLDDH